MTLSSTTYQPSSTPPSPARTVPPNLPKRKRGGQAANQNARKAGTFSAFQPGPLTPTRALIKDLNLRLQDPASPLDQVVAQARAARQELPLPAPADVDKFVPVFRMYLQLFSIITRAYSACIPFIRRSEAFSSIARDPFGWFERDYRASGISRDADSFFPVSEKSAQYSPLPDDHPRLATNLTDSQWAVLAPLIPPDPHLDWLTGQPPILIAASRWGFTQYQYTGEFNDFVVMENYHKILQRFPALCEPLDLAQHPVGANVYLHLGRGGGWGRGRGRPRTSPRALLDAIFWKLATAQAWQALPIGFPPMRLCRKYYRRLFLSGRLYTLLLALYNQMCFETSIDLPALLEADVFTTTPAQKIALRPDAPPTHENYTALLFMQLARSAYTRLRRQDRHLPPICARFPDFKGVSALSTGELPVIESQQSPLSKCVLPFGDREATCPRRGSRSVAEGGSGEGLGSLPPGMGAGFEPLESSLAWQKWSKIERDQNIIAQEVAKRLNSASLPDFDDPISSLLDE